MVLVTLLRVILGISLLIGVSQPHIGVTASTRLGPDGNLIAWLNQSLTYDAKPVPCAGTMVKYYYAGGQRVAMRDGSTRYWLFSNHLGSTAITADNNGAQVAELRYKAWGENRYTNGTTPTSYRFTGQREESTLGLYYYGARWYDAVLGRFVQADTLVQSQECALTVSYAEPDVLQRCNGKTGTAGKQSDTQGLNRYSYALNNPLYYTDPDGHFAFVALLIPGVIGATAGGLGYIASVALTGREFNVKSFAVATGVGFVAGAAAPVVAINAVSAVALGLTANVTQYALTQVVNEQPLSIQDAAINAGAGVVGGAITGPYTANALRASVDLVGARMVAPEFYKEISRQILWEDMRLGLGNLVRSAGGSFAANTLPTWVEPGASSPIASTGSTEIVYVPVGGPIPW